MNFHLFYQIGRLGGRLIESTEVKQVKNLGRTEKDSVVEYFLVQNQFIFKHGSNRTNTQILR